MLGLIDHWTNSNTSFLCRFSTIAENGCLTGKNITHQASALFPSVLPSQENSLLVTLKSWAFAEMMKVMSREGNWRQARKRKLIYIK